MAGWRDRVDRKSNWGITLAAAMLSIGFSKPNAHHSVILFAMMLLHLVLTIEARRQPLLRRLTPAHPRDGAQLLRGHVQPGAQFQAQLAAPLGLFAFVTRAHKGS